MKYMKLKIRKNKIKQDLKYETNRYKYGFQKM